MVICPDSLFLQAVVGQAWTSRPRGSRETKQVKLQSQKEVLPSPAVLEHGRIRWASQLPMRETNHIPTARNVIWVVGI